MASVDRNEPQRAASSDSLYSVMEFVREFPDDAACLDWLWRARFAPDGQTADCPKCERQRRFHRVAARPSYSCDTCGHHLHPTAGTIFHKSSTSLHLWFYAMFLASQTRCGISAKQLEREIGVSYKTAWRMLNLIRNQLMSDQGEDPLSGDVEADETYVGGKPRAYETRTAPYRGLTPTGRERKVPIFGMVERGGRVRVRVHAYANASGLVRRSLYENVLPASMIFTDEWAGFKGTALSRYYLGHRRIRHAQRVYVDGTTHTQTIEGFFGLVKSGIRGVYHAVSAKWLQGYLNEYAWRYNRRDDERPMFESLLLRAAH